MLDSGFSSFTLVTFFVAMIELAFRLKHGNLSKNTGFLGNERMGKKRKRFQIFFSLFLVFCFPYPKPFGSYLVDPASSHMLVSKIKPCMSKYKPNYTAKLRMAH
jgi:hypothetical protein